MDRRSCLTLTALGAAGLAMTSLYRLGSAITGEIPLYFKR